MNTVECALCGEHIQFTDAGVTHLKVGKCTAEGMALDDAGLRKFAAIIFGAPRGSAYRMIADAPRMYPPIQQVLKSVTLLRDGHPSPWFRTGETMTVRIEYAGATAAKPYFGIYIMNELAERVSTVHSTHQGALDLPTAGVIDCAIPDLRLGEGAYHVMVDFGTSNGNRAHTESLDCVPNAGKFKVRLDGFLGGVGHTAFDGAAITSNWRTI